MTISPDGSLITAIGPFVYLNDQVWGGTYQIGIPSPLNTSPVVAKLVSLSTSSNTALNLPAPGLVGYAEFNKRAVALLSTHPTHASSFVLNQDGSFSYTPKTGFAGNDSFTYDLQGPYGLSTVGKVKISVGSPQ